MTDISCDTGAYVPMQSFTNISK